MHVIDTYISSMPKCSFQFMIPAKHRGGPISRSEIYNYNHSPQRPKIIKASPVALKNNHFLIIFHISEKYM